MIDSATKKTCFVIMPYGDKLNVDERLINAVYESIDNQTPIPKDLAETIRFDTIHKHIIEKAARELDLECIRCDEIKGAGSMHEDMFRHILECDVAIVDISGLSANVFYELGIRHTLRRNVTVLIQREGTRIPFNIEGYRVITYDERDLEKADRATKEIVAFIKTGLETRDHDSPIYKHLPDLNVVVGSVRRQLDIIPETVYYDYEVTGAPDVKVGLVTGDIERVRGVDVWVNSENRNMQMARYHDASVSGSIRWLGARKNRITNKVLEDTIALELAELMEGQTEVEAGTVIPTHSGQLLETHGVKRIFHAAVVEGYPRQGYRLIPDFGRCVTRALELMDELAAEELESILVPLMGTGTGGGRIDEALNLIVGRSIAYLKANPATNIRHIHLLAPTTEILTAGVAALDRASGLRRA